MRATLPLSLLLVSSSFAYGQADHDHTLGVRHTGEEYDPWKGIDQDGRIPKVQLPDGTVNPDRWRYVPEGRIKPGNPLERFLLSTFITPIILFEQDIGGGGGLAYTDIDFRNQRRQEFLGMFLTYTSEGQQRYEALWRRWLHHNDVPGANGGVMTEERSFLRATASYERTLTRRFFGLGPETDEDMETSYTDEFGFAEVGAQLSWPQPGDDLIAFGNLRLEHRNLSRGRVSDIPSTDDVYPGLFAQGDGRDSVWLEFGIAYDTRDSQHAPYHGWRAGAQVDWIVSQTDLDPGAVITLDASWVTPVGGIFHDGGDEDEEHPPTDTIAIGALFKTSEGDVPFYNLPSLGGRDTLRGFIGNRWTGDSAWHLAAEYRMWFIPRGFPLFGHVRVERMGLAFFAECGAVASDPGKFDDATIQTSVGTSLRVSLERQAQFRFDFGFSDEDFNFVIAYGYSF